MVRLHEDGAHPDLNPTISSLTDSSVELFIIKLRASERTLNEPYGVALVSELSSHLILSRGILVLCQ